MHFTLLRERLEGSLVSQNIDYIYITNRVSQERDSQDHEAQQPLPCSSSTVLGLRKTIDAMTQRLPSNSLFCYFVCPRKKVDLFIGTSDKVSAKGRCPPNRGYVISIFHKKRLGPVICVHLTGVSA